MYTKIYGTPWEKYQQQVKMETYLEGKYHHDFGVQNTTFNSLSETYQAYAYVKNNPQLLFMVQQDLDARAGYSDAYPKVFWDSDISSGMKEQFISYFPKLDVPTLKALRIVDRGEYFGPHIPTYNEIHASQIACSITINIMADWEKIDLVKEKERIAALSQYLQEQHFPVLVEIRYYKQKMYNDEKVYFITEDGKIIEK